MFLRSNVRCDKCPHKRKQSTEKKRANGAPQATTRRYQLPVPIEKALLQRRVLAVVELLAVRRKSTRLLTGLVRLLVALLLVVASIVKLVLALDVGVF